MKGKLFVFAIGLVVALLSISVIAVMVYPNYFTTQNEESLPPLPEYTSPPDSSGSAESADPPEDVSLPEESASDTAEWGSGQVYDGSAPIIRKMGEELRINALKHRKQTEKPPTSTEVFASWEGEMSFTVTSAELFDSIEETGLNYDEFIDEFELYEDTYKPLVIKLTVKNINANSAFDEPYTFFSDNFRISSKEEFSPEKFRSHADGEWRIGSGMPLVYVDPHMDGPYDYFHYTLKEGETINFTMCYYADTAAVPINELYLEIATNSKDHRFGITLDQLKGVE